MLGITSRINTSASKIEREWKEITSKFGEMTINHYLLLAFYHIVVRHQEKPGKELINKFERMSIKQKIALKNEGRITKDTITDKNNVII